MRESTERQAGPDHFGPDLQRAGIRDYCERNDIPLPKREYFDAASGRSLEGRDSLQDALADAERGEYDLLLLYHSSRSFRNRHDAAVAKRKLRAAGVGLVFTSHNLISGDPGRKVEEGILELMDELRSDEQALFVASGLRQKFERGLHNGTVPLGYERHRAPVGDGSNGELRIVTHEADTVRRVFELYAGGQLSELEVPLALNAEADAEGRPVHITKRGDPFSKGGVREILGNRLYVGMVVWHPYTDEEQVLPGRHEAIIPQEVFDRVQQVKASRVHWTGRRPANRVYLLSRRAVCFDCGARVAGDTSGSRGRRRMRHSRTGRCDTWRSRDARVLEDQEGEFIKERMSLPTDWQKSVQKLLKQPPPESGSNAQLRAGLERAMENLGKQHLWQHISDDDYRRRHEDLARSLADIPRDGPESHGLHDYPRAAELLGDLGDLWIHPGVSDEQRKELLGEVFEQVQIDELGIRTVRPTETCLPLLAVGEVGGKEGGAESPFSRSRPYLRKARRSAGLLLARNR